MQEGQPYQIILTRVFSLETQEEYVARCKDIVNYIIQRSAHLHLPSTFNFDDTSKFRKVDENTYETVSPYEPLEGSTPSSGSQYITHVQSMRKMA